MEFNLPPVGTGADMVQLGCSVKGVRGGDTDVRMVIAPLTFD